MWATGIWSLLLYGCIFFCLKTLKHENRLILYSFCLLPGNWFVSFICIIVCFFPSACFSNIFNNFSLSFKTTLISLFKINLLISHLPHILYAPPAWVAASNPVHSHLDSLDSLCIFLFPFIFILICVPREAMHSILVSRCLVYLFFPLF